MKRITRYNQYKNDFFNKLRFGFQKGRKILDVGCGEGTDAAVFINDYKLNWYGIDVYKHENMKRLGKRFKIASILKLPYKKEMFDYVFVHDVLHHVDELKQRKSLHMRGLKELRRICKKDGTIIVVEGNRFNPLFYPHMVLLRGHEHFRQSYFTDIIKEVFSKDGISFRYFEAHLYPGPLLPLFKLYEWVMEHISPKEFLAYNAAIIRKK